MTYLFNLVRNTSPIFGKIKHIPRGKVIGKTKKKTFSPVKNIFSTNATEDVATSRVAVKLKSTASRFVILIINPMITHLSTPDVLFLFLNLSLPSFEKKTLSP